MDIQSFQRLMSLFPPMAQPGLDTYSNSGLTNPEPVENVDNADLMNQYQPKHAISDQLVSKLGSMPERPVPGRLRSIGAALAGFGAGSSAQGIVGGQPIGYKYDPRMADIASDKVKYGDFDNQLNDWQNQVKALGIGATEEDRANAGEVTRLKNNATNEINQQKVDVARQRADSYQQSIEVKEKAETDKHEFAMKKLADNVAQADKKLMLAKQNYELKKTSTEAMQAYHNAELASIAARREAQTEDDKFKREQLQRKNDSIIERNRILNEATSMKSGATEKQTSTSIFDANGKLTDRKVTTTGAKKSNVITDPETGHLYDTTTWSEGDKAAAAKKGWK
jgi:hypothetical protein